MGALSPYLGDGAAAGAGGKPVCPECGTRVDAAAGGVRVRVVWAVRWLPWVGVMAVAAMLLGGVFFNQKSWNGNGPTSVRWQPCAGKLTRAQLQAIADGTQDGREFAQGLHGFLASPWTSGDERVEVRLMDLSGARYETVAYGWPVTVLTTQTQSQFEDVFDQTGPVAKDWGVETHAFWTNSWMSRSGGVVAPSRTTHFSQAGPIAVVILLVVAAGYVGWWVGGLRKGSKRRRRAGALAGAGIGAGALLLAGLVAKNEQTLYSLEPTHATYGASAAPHFVTSHTGWKQKGLLTLLATKDGAAQAATKLLSVLPEDEEPEKVVEFGTIWTPGPFTETSVGWPTYWMTWGHVDLATNATGTTSGWRQKGWHINEARQGQAWYAWDSGGQRRYFGVFLPELAMLVLLGWIVWKGLRGIERLVEWRLVRKRVARGWCVVCGYDLAGIRGEKGNE